MISGVKFRIYPSTFQKAKLSQWAGAQRFIWNAKVEEEKYLRTFARKYLPIGTYPEQDQTYSQYKSKEVCPWIYEIPSQVLRNSATRWYQTNKRFLRGECGRPRIKKKRDEMSLYLTRELFTLETHCDQILLNIGTKTNNLGLIRWKSHRSFDIPASITIKRQAGCWTVSFSYGSEECSDLDYQNSCLSFLRDFKQEELKEMVVGIDRGIKVSFQVGGESLSPDLRSKNKHKAQCAYIRKHQRRLARQEKGSGRRNKTKSKIATINLHIANRRLDFIHKATYSLCRNQNYKAFIFEDLSIKKMSRAPRSKARTDGKGFLPNGANAKAGLNRTILDQSWAKFETVLLYKARKYGKVCFKISPEFTSQECADCAHIHPENRLSRDVFLCLNCGHRDHADRNAAMVLKKRAIKLILDSGTELSDRGVLTPRLDSGRGAKVKTGKAKADQAIGKEASKKRKKSGLDHTKSMTSSETPSFLDVGSSPGDQPVIIEEFMVIRA